jgi:hypothetical protein
MGLHSRRQKGKKTGMRGDSMDLYVRCDRCGEIIKTHIFMGNELYPTYDDAGPAYTLRKELIGAKCPNRVQLYMEFDSARRLTRQEVTGGTLQDMKDL